jgi:uncharacterized membrane protein YhhN
MPSQVVVLVALVGAAHLAAYYAGRRALAGTLKALPILTLASVAATTDAPVTPRYAGLVTAGLLLSALGDVCLVWPERFTMGLASFLLAHCCYLAAFVLGAGHGGTAWPWLTGIALASGGLLAVLWPHLGRLRGPVLVYVVVIAAMAYAAARRAGLPGTPAPSGALALAGALIFMTSDGILAVDRFARRFSPAYALVMITYYAAQTLITASVTAVP